MMIPSGETVHGEYNGSDASGGEALTLYGIGGVARTLGSNERLVISDYLIVSATGGDVHLSAGAAAAGKYIARGTVAANGGLSAFLVSPHFLAPGEVPEVTAPAGAVDCIIHGVIVRV